MQNVMSFTTWFLGQLPTFLMSEPICYVWILLILAYIIRLILSFK